MDFSTSQSHSASLKIARQGLDFLQKQSTRLPGILPKLRSNESVQSWRDHEELLLACLRTGDDKTALQCLERLESRFGEKNERVQALRGVYRETTATNDAAIKDLLKEYDAALIENPTNLPLAKRRVVLFRELGRLADATACLASILESSPTDAEAWAELSDLYFSQGMLSQAAFCLEEVLLIVPNAWNVHARLGEILYISAQSAASGKTRMELLSEAVSRQCRAAELCDGYLRALYGLRLSTDSILRDSTGLDSASSEVSKDTVKQLHSWSIDELAKVVRLRAEGSRSVDADRDPELIAAQALLDRTAKDGVS